MPTATPPETAEAIQNQPEHTETDSQRPTGPWSAPVRALTAGILLTVVGIAFETLSIATVLPATADDLQGLGLYGAAFSAFLLTNIVGTVVAGILADRRGPALPYVLGVAIFVAGLVVGGLAPTMPVLILGRALQGFGGGAIGGIAYVALGRVYPAAAKPAMLAYMSSAWVVPGLIGPGVAGVVAETVGWRWVFLGLIPFPLLATVLVLPALRPLRGGDAAADTRGRLIGAVLLAIGATILLVGLGQPEPVAAIGLAALGLALGGPALRRVLPEGTLTARPGLPAAVLAMGLLNFGFLGIEAFLPLALVDVRGRSIAFAGLVLTVVTITWTIGSWVQARLVARTSRRLLVRVGLSVLIVGAVLFLLTLVPTFPAEIAILGWGLGGIGMGLAYATLSLTVLERAASGQEGAASASLQLASALGSGLGAGVGGAVINAFAGGGGLATALFGQSVAMIGLLVATWVLAGRVPDRGPAKANEPAGPDGRGAE